MAIFRGVGGDDWQRNLQELPDGRTPVVESVEQDDVPSDALAAAHLGRGGLLVMLGFPACSQLPDGWQEALAQMRRFSGRVLDVAEMSFVHGWTQSEIAAELAGGRGGAGVGSTLEEARRNASG